MISHARIKAFFFDRERVIKAVDAGTRRVLSKFGSYVWQRAKTSIKRRKATSEPGSQPSSHTGILKRFLFFGYEPERRSVVIGPSKTNQVFFDNHRRPVKGTVPEALEYGGDITIMEVFKYGRWQRADLRSRRRNAGLPTRYRRVSIAPRPYMHPAYEAEKSKLPPMWADSVK